MALLIGPAHVITQNVIKKALPLGKDFPELVIKGAAIGLVVV